MNLPAGSRTWWQGIVFRSLAGVALITMLLGGISTAIIQQTVAERQPAEIPRTHAGEQRPEVEFSPVLGGEVLPRDRIPEQ